VWPARKADNLAAICEPTSQPYRPPRPVTRICLLYSSPSPQKCILVQNTKWLTKPRNFVVLKYHYQSPLEFIKFYYKISYMDVFFKNSDLIQKVNSLEKGHWDIWKALHPKAFGHFAAQLQMCQKMRMRYVHYNAFLFRCLQCVLRYYVRLKLLHCPSILPCLHRGSAEVMTASVVMWSEYLAAERRCIVFPLRYEVNLYMLCRRK
jgi:hypothetical protein